VSRPMRHAPLHFAEDDWDGEQDDDLETFRISPAHPRRRKWVTTLIAVIVLGLVAGALAIVWVRRQVDPPGRPGAAVQVAIPLSSSGGRIASILGKAGVIHSPSVFRLYVKISGAGPLRPGAYTLHRNEKYSDVVTTLEKGPPPAPDNPIRLTIPEGFTIAQIAARIGKLPGLSADKFLAATTGGQVRSRYQPPGSTNLEGLLFPATYDIRPNEDETTILRLMVQKFDDTATAVGMDQAAAHLGLTAYQLITVASMVEREAKLDADRGPIASVIYNRIQKGIALQIDATLLYGEHLTDPHKIDLKADTPYNTYKFKGLPPTPIASAGAPSLEAAATPPTTTYLYYVLIDQSGKHAFATTAAEFNKLRAEAKAKGLL
jgi:UPF0755 protein